ncbi:CRISPR-associated endonuclease Cas9 [Synergistales bacterium]|nr:CRISPR-associated endonuclease Cas9 [Synergistales bacterium]
MRYVLGLDIGIASVGWCVIDEGSDETHPCIVDLGVRVFPQAENPKDGSSLALVRRVARGSRRRLRRRKERLGDIRKLLVKHKLAKDEENLKNMLSASPSPTPWELRAAGLDRLLSHDDFCRVLFHIAKHRGFKSNRKSDAEGASEKAKTEGALLSGVSDNKKRLSEKGYRTVGEMMWKDPFFEAHKRNKGGDYSSTVARDMLIDEIHLLFDAQRRYGGSFASSALEQKYTELFAFQLPVVTGDQIEKMTGNCTLLPEFKRAPTMGYTSELFKLFSRALNLRLTGRGKDEALNDEQRMTLISLAFKNSKLTYDQIRRALELDEPLAFKGVRYGRKETREKSEGATFVELKGYHSLRKAIEKSLGKGVWQALSGNGSRMDTIAKALTFYKSDEDIENFLLEAGIEKEIVEAVLPLSFRGFMHLSTEAISRLLPYMEQGDGYDVACQKAGFCHYDPQGTTERLPKLPPLEAEEGLLGETIPRNPVVVRALSQVRKVVNAIIDRYGAPTYVNIELARDLSRPFDERRAIQKGQDENRRERERVAKDISETFGIPNPSGSDILKYRLWKEQHSKCAYSQTPIDEQRLFEPGYAEIDHILPYSRSMDDSYSNKILVLSSENQNKKNRTPYEYLSSMPERWEFFEDWVCATIHSAAKRGRLLKKSLTDADAEEMTERNLTDTRYITRFASNWLKRRLTFADEAEKNPVLCVNGHMTALLRGRWGLAKKREEGDSHHALDAAVIASATPSMVKRISDYSRRKELLKLRDDTGAKKEHYPAPWPEFRNELTDKLKNLFVSRAPRRKAKGAAHQETIRSFKDRGGSEEEREKWLKGTVLRTPIKSLNLNNIENMVGKGRDRRLYEALKERLRDFDGKGEKAFAEAFYKPTIDGSQGPVVHTVKLYTTGASGIPVRGGMANNGEMIRVDVYKKGGKFHLVPHYVDDIAKKRVKKLAIVAHKPESQWTKIDDSFEFCFSLFKDDLVSVEPIPSEKSNKEVLFYFYYTGTDRSTGGINIEAHDRSREWRGIGVKTCSSFEKYHVDVLGGWHKIDREKPPVGREN